jgi:hypothetical protein
MYANGNVYKEAGQAVAYCSLLCIHRAILMQYEKQVAVHQVEIGGPNLWWVKLWSKWVSSI